MRIPVGNSFCFYEVAYITDPAFAERSEKHLELASVYKRYIYIYIYNVNTHLHSAAQHFQKK